MNSIKVLLINYGADAFGLYSPLLSAHGITPQAASTMTEALNMLLENDYSGIVINADSFEYLPYLKIMRALTAVPIGIG